MWTEENGSKVHFSDEDQLNLFGTDRKRYVLLQTGEILNPKCVSERMQNKLGVLYSYTAKSECKCLSEPPSAT